ncbi:MAG: threonine--tRNA ligase [Actinomycetia bacterium]|nr:threonine--tRNA ligase [Actinomycetes bacterium]MCP4224547.1 threonine--tRNA ligase [Actinomycetes bacterium]MCP5034226.1 threonine--tRNA ligase [Actinomycetes bacterium]
MVDIAVSLPDGSERSVPAGSTAADLAASIGKRLARDAVIAVIDGTEVDLDTELAPGQTIEIITADSEQGLEILRHSTAHVLAQAVLELWPGATFAIGPPIENGFYYDFQLPAGDDGAPQTFSDDDLTVIEAKMRDIVAAGQPFIRSEMDPDAAAKLMADHPYKRELIAQVSSGERGGAELAGEVATRTAETISFYRNTDGFVDMCVGPHVPSTGRLSHFKLQHVAGAYWRGDERQPMLQRIYGTAWADKKQLAAHLHRLEEAAKRDHRKLANELDLLSFPSELGGGLAVWHPRGAIVRKLMEDYSRFRHETGGYEFAFTPHLAKSDLFETSGHLDFYADSMYPPMEMDNGTYYPKPMNCPMHVLIYRSRQRSYRELPLRLYELGTVYRYERAGTLHGLMRIRGFTQDDSHVFTTQEQLGDELASLLAFVLDLLRAFGFDDFQAKLSTKPEEKFVGSDEIWTFATECLEAALAQADVPYVVDEGGGAFYGPKIDVDVRDAIGRSWQLSTIQADFNLPDRFNLEYVASDGSRRQPVMIHRALFGSIERFFGVLLEHFEGNLPLWLAPVQVEVLPVAAGHELYAASVQEQLEAEGLRVEVSAATDPLGRRIRNAKKQKVPYVLVVGDDDVAASTVGVNPRGGDSSSVERDVKVSELINRLVDEVGTRG